jgi:hypothetical protein
MQTNKIIVAGLDSQLTATQIQQAFAQRCDAEISVKMLGACPDGTLRALVTFDDLLPDISLQTAIDQALSYNGKFLAPQTKNFITPDVDDPKTALKITQLPPKIKIFFSQEADNKELGIPANIMRIITEECQNTDCSVALRSINPAYAELVTNHLQRKSHLRIAKDILTKDKTVQSGVFKGGLSDIELTQKPSGAFPIPLHRPPKKEPITTTANYCHMPVTKSLAEINALIENGSLIGPIIQDLSGDLFVKFNENDPIIKKLIIEYYGSKITKREISQYLKYSRIRLSPANSARAETKSKRTFNASTTCITSALTDDTVFYNLHLSLAKQEDAPRIRNPLILEPAISFDKKQRFACPIGPDLDPRSISFSISTPEKCTENNYDFSRRDEKLRALKVFITEYAIKTQLEKITLNLEQIDKSDTIEQFQTEMKKLKAFNLIQDLLEAMETISGTGTISEILFFYKINQRIKQELGLPDIFKNLCDHSNPGGSRDFYNELMAFPGDIWMLCENRTSYNQAMQAFILNNKARLFQEDQMPTIHTDMSHDFSDTDELSANLRIADGSRTPLRKSSVISTISLVLSQLSDRSLSSGEKNKDRPSPRRFSCCGSGTNTPIVSPQKGTLTPVSEGSNESASPITSSPRR